MKSIKKYGFLILMAFCFTLTVHAQVDSNDPDVPPLGQAIDKGEYLKMRAIAIGQMRGLDAQKEFNPTWRIAAIEKMEMQKKVLESQQNPGNRIGPWLPIGPAPIPNGQVAVLPQTPVSGRTISIAVHPTNPNIVYVGTAQGGLYRTINGGINWVPLMDGALSLAIGAIAIAPSQPETIYVGTGEPNLSADSFFGVGVYRIDNASTTATLSGPLNKNASNVDVLSGNAVSEIMVHPTNPAQIFVGTTSAGGGIFFAFTTAGARGIFRCDNATAANPVFTKFTTNLAQQDVSCRDLIIDPSNPDILLANMVVSGGGVIRSVNASSGTVASATFTTVQTFTGGTNELTAEFAAIHPAGDANATFYTATGNGGGRVLKSVDGGATFTQTIDNNFCTPQCFYDIAIAIDPLVANTVYLGGSPTLTSAKSINGGVSFVESRAGVHVDTHVLAVAPSDGTQVWLGTDGGIYKSINAGATWTPLNNTEFSATQFMSLAVHPTDPNFTIGGTQDNGTQFYNPAGAWTRADFGDGGYAQIDQNAANTTNVRMYHTYFNASNLQGYGTVNNIASATDNGWSFRGCQSGGATVNGITCTGTIQFYAPLERGPGNPNTIYYGSDRLYRSADEGLSHTVVSQNPISSGSAITAIGISPQNDNVRLVGLSNGLLRVTTTGSSTLTDADATNVVPNNSIARAIIDPNNASVAYVTLSAYNVTNVYKTTNLSEVGTTWAAAATGMPQVPVNAFAVDPLNSNNVFAGTDIGVYASVNAGANWFPLGTGLPKVAVFGMTVVPANHKLRIATHGKGMWEIDIATALPVDNFVFDVVESPKNKAALRWSSDREFDFKHYEIERSIYNDQNVNIEWAKVATIAGKGISGNGAQYNLTDAPTGGNQFVYRIKLVNNDNSFRYSATELVSFKTNSSTVYDPSPNPAQTTSMLKYELGSETKVNISLRASNGAMVKKILDTRQKQGIYQTEINTNNLPAGTYLIVLKTDTEQFTKRLTIQ